MRSWGIGAKLALQITVAIVLVVGAVGVLAIYQQERKFTSILQTRAEWTAEQLAITLEMPMWNMDDAQIDHILHSYLLHPDILAIRLVEPGSTEAVRYVAKDPLTLEPVEKLPRGGFEYGDAFSLASKVGHEEGVIGGVEITFSREFVTTQVREATAAVTIGLVALIGVVTAILLLLVRRRISAPLAANVRAAAQIAGGRVDVELERIDSGDEIGALNAAFHRMIAYMREMARQATRIAAGDLQGEYRPHSADDALGNAFQDMTRYLQEMAEVAGGGPAARRGPPPARPAARCSRIRRRMRWGWRSSRWIFCAVSSARSPPARRGWRRLRSDSGRSAGRRRKGWRSLPGRSTRYRRPASR